MEVPSNKDKGKAILDPNEEENITNNPKRARFNVPDPEEITNLSHDEILEDQNAIIPIKRSSIKAPLGIPFCRPSYCGPFGHPYDGSFRIRTCTSFDPNVSGSCTYATFDLNEDPPPSPEPPSTGSCTNIGTGIITSTGTDLFVNRGELFDTESMRTRMEKIAKVKELDGLSSEAAEVLNTGLDVYLKRIIGSCLGIVRAGRGEGNPNPISMDDLFVAMQINPDLLGERSSEKLEKILQCTFKE